MNIQEILVYIFILAATSYTLYSIIQIFSKKDVNSCGCSSCDFKSDIADLKKVSPKTFQKVL